jgi:hypothetical protein
MVSLFVVYMNIHLLSLLTDNDETLYRPVIYRVSHEERSLFWKVKVSIILSKKVCPITNRFSAYGNTVHTVHCTQTDEEYAISSHWLQSALMLMAEF